MTQEQRIINKEREKMRLEKLVGKKNKNRGSKDDEKNQIIDFKIYWKEIFKSNKWRPSAIESGAIINMNDKFCYLYGGKYSGGPNDLIILNLKNG